MALSQDIKERIFAAADSLHAASETGEFPSVEAVRQESHAGMNNVVEAMKEWRQKQRKQVQAVREPLPVELHGSVLSMGQSLWETAQQLANESLDAAKVAFETEKSDLIQLSAEQSEAFETQAAELDKAQRNIAELERQALADKKQIEVAGTILADTRDELRAAKQTVDLANQKAEEIERRAAELRAELNHAHAEAEAAATAANATADRMRTERDKAQQRHELAEAENAKLAASLAAAQGETMKAQAALAGLAAKAEATEQAHQEQRKQSDAEAHRAAEHMTKAQAERDDATKAATEARERAAGLAGQLHAMQEQIAALLAAIKPHGEQKPKKTPPAKA